MSRNDKITKAAGVVASATLLSRILGLIRDFVTAYYFGAGQAADAFFVAFRIPNLLRRLLAEGALTVSFIPIFTEYLTKRTREETCAMVHAMLGVFSLILAAVAILGILLSPYIIWAFAPGFNADPDKFALTVLLTRIMFPYIFLVALVALAMGILNSVGKFAAPALSPVFLNIGMIGAVFLLYRRLDPPILSLSIGVLVGGIMQVLLQIPSLAKEKGLLGLSLHFRHPALKRIGLLMIPATFGAAMYQFTVFINTLLASFLPEGSVSYLYYADRIMQFPLGVFALAVGTAVFPVMAREAAAGNREGVKDTLAYALKLVSFITLPATVGMIALARPLMELIFQHGEFDAASTAASAEALIAYALGLYVLSAVQILVRVFYSYQDTSMPAKIAAVSLTANLLAGVTLMGPLKHNGLALASTIGSAVNFVILVVVLRKRLGGIQGRSICLAALRQMAWAAVMALAVLAIRHGGSLFASAYTRLLVQVVGGTVGGCAVYFGLAMIFRAPEMEAVRGIVRRRFRKGQAAAGPAPAGPGSDRPGAK